MAAPTIKVALLTVSDRCFNGEKGYEDKSGKELENYITKKWEVAEVTKRDCVPDEVEDIRKTLESWSDSEECKIDVILTIGGTGVAGRDVTPEATKMIIDKEASGFVIAMMQGSLKSTPMAMLSRSTSGIRKNTLIINLPGSPKGSMENFLIVKDQLKHAVSLLRNDTKSVADQHAKLSADSSKAPVLNTKVDERNIAGRNRKSPYKLISVEECQNVIIKECEGLQEQIMTNLSKGVGCILASDIVSKDPLPPFPASIKDGYAVKVVPNMDILEVLGDSTAGDAPNKLNVDEGLCARVSTGAPVPQGCDAVIQVEDTELIEATKDGNDEKRIKILKQPNVGQDIRGVGSDIPIGKVILDKGTFLGPSELGTLAAIGVSSFPVYNKPNIALLSTGNELQAPEQELKYGKIRDSNKTTLKALLERNNFETIDSGIAVDNPQDLLTKLHYSLSRAQVLVCTGGVSMGEKDYLKRVLLTDLNAKIHFGSVLMKPGKPTTFATCDFKGEKKFIFGLPGNPVSATVTSFLFVLPACKLLSGWSNPFPFKLKVSTKQQLKLDCSRPEYHRARIFTEDGKNIPTAESTGNQISSRLMSCNSANVLLCLPQGVKGKLEVLPEMSVVDALMF